MSSETLRVRPLAKRCALTPTEQGWVVWALACLAGLGASVAAQDGSSVRVAGYYKNLWQRSETWAAEPYNLDVNRLRLELKGKLSSTLSFDLHYDNEVLLGSYLRTAQFTQQKDAAAPHYWRAQANYVDRASWHGVHRLYRAQLRGEWGDTMLRIGRQRIAWGTGRFWSPIDLLNPISPVALEREERPGVDAVLVEQRFGPVARLAGVYAPSRQSGRGSRALQWHDNSRGVDYSVTVGRFWGDAVIGLDLASQLGTAGVRAEFSRTRPPIGRTFRRALLGIDYAFANTLTLSAELYHDSSGASSPAAYDFSALVTGRRQTLAQRYVGLRASYALTPLLKLNGDVVLNLSDRSRYLAPSAIYSLRTDLDLTIGLQYFGGAPGSELARPPSAVHASVQWFF